MGQRTPELLALAKVLNSPPKNIVFDFFEHIIKHIVMFAEMDGYDPAPRPSSLCNAHLECQCARMPTLVRYLIVTRIDS